MLSQTEIDAHIAALDVKTVTSAYDSLHRYVRLVWPLVVPERFIDGKHVHALCDHLQAVSEGHIESLLVNVPPGSSKSTIVCVIWPTWEWIKDPAHRFIFASYSDANVRRDATKAVRILQSEWHIERFGHILDGLKQSTKRVQTLAGGFRFATTVKGAGCGEHAKTRVVDDPIKPLDAQGGSKASNVKLEEVISWYGGTLSNRATDSKPRDVCIMQRVHQRDLAAHIKDTSPNVVQLRLPMLFDDKKPCRTSYKRTTPSGKVVPVEGGDWRTKKGELLCPERWDAAAVEQRRIKYGIESVFQCQDNQDPTPRGGNMVKAEWLRYWHPDGQFKFDPNGRPCIALPTKGGTLNLQSWDLAFTDNATSSRVACSVFTTWGPYIALRDFSAERLDFTASCDAVVEMSHRWPTANTRLIENKANGSALENTLKEVLPGIELVETGTGSKPMRLLAVLPEIRSGHLLLPHPELEGCDVKAWRKELCSFPKGATDDIVDTLTQAMRWRTHASTHIYSAAMANV